MVESRPGISKQPRRYSVPQGEHLGHLWAPAGQGMSWAAGRGSPKKLKSTAHLGLRQGVLRCQLPPWGKGWTLFSRHSCGEGARKKVYFLFMNTPNQLLQFKTPSVKTAQLHVCVCTRELTHVHPKWPSPYKLEPKSHHSTELVPSFH